MKLSRQSHVAAPEHVAAQQTRNEEAKAAVETLDPLALGSPMPKSLGRCADLFHDVRELRLMMEKECEAIKARETEIQEHIIRTLPKGDTGASGLRYRAQINTDTKPQVSDEKGGWPAVWKFIKQNDRFDLLQKRLGEKAITDMWADGVEVPGVAKVHVPKLSITKI
jgi:hypothetical protein